MHILHMISSTNRAGGGPIEGIIQLNHAMDALGHSSEIVTVDEPDAPWLAGFPIPVWAVGGAKMGYRYSPHLLPWLMQHGPQYDCFIVNGLWQYHGLAVRQAASRLDKPYFVYAHGMLDPWFKHSFPLKHLKKLLYWPWGEYRVLRDAAAVCFTCEEEKLLARQSFRLYKARETVVRYGTSAPPDEPDRQRAAFLAEYPQLLDTRNLLFLGRLHPKKGCDLLVDAFAHVASHDPSLRLIIAGPDQAGWQTALQTQSERLGVADRIIWPGMLAGDRKWGAFRVAETFVLPSHQENFGIAVAEALACGLPVLISDKVNIWREVEQDGAGLVQSDTVEGTTRLLSNWLALSEGERHEMAAQARKCFAERFEIMQAARSLLAVIQKNTQEMLPCPQL